MTLKSNLLIMSDLKKILKIFSKPWLVPGYVQREFVLRSGRIKFALVSPPSNLWGRAEKSKNKEALAITTEQVVRNA